MAQGIIYERGRVVSVYHMRMARNNANRMKACANLLFWSVFWVCLFFFGDAWVSAPAFVDHNHNNGTTAVELFNASLPSGVDYILEPLAMAGMNALMPPPPPP